MQQNSLKDITEGDIEITNNEYTLFFKQTTKSVQLTAKPKIAYIDSQRRDESIFRNNRIDISKNLPCYKKKEIPQIALVKLRNNDYHEYSSTLSLVFSLPDLPIGGWPSLLNHLKNLLAVVAAGGLQPSSITTPLLLLLLLL